MFSLLVAAGVGYLAAHATTRTTILNFALNNAPRVVIWLNSFKSIKPN